MSDISDALKDVLGHLSYHNTDIGDGFRLGLDGSYYCYVFCGIRGRDPDRKKWIHDADCWFGNARNSLLHGDDDDVLVGYLKRSLRSFYGDCIDTADIDDFPKDFFLSHKL